MYIVAVLLVNTTSRLSRWRIDKSKTSDYSVLFLFGNGLRCSRARIVQGVALIGTVMAIHDYIHHHPV